jgi:hypothetical protein
MRISSGNESKQYLSVTWGRLVTCGRLAIGLPIQVDPQTINAMLIELVTLEGRSVRLEPLSKKRHPGLCYIATARAA